MSSDSAMSTVTVRAPASSANLGPGFDVLAAALGVHLTVEVGGMPQPGRDPVVDPGAPALPADRSNLVVRSFERLHPADGLEFRIRGGIPSARGLGSSAAAIVGGLAAAQAVRDGSLDRAGLFREAVAVEGHPDNVAAAIYGGFVACPPGEGEPALIAAPDGLSAVLVIPDAPVSTAKARAALPREVPVPDAVVNIAAASQLVLGLERGDLDLVGRGLADRLHQGYRASLFPDAAAIIDRAAGFGALGATVSGAGPSILVWCESGAAGRVADELGGVVDGWGRVMQLPFDADGVSITG